MVTSLQELNLQKKRKKKLKILRVAVLTPIRLLFDYLPNTNDIEQTSPLVPGLRVKVPFGSQKKIGIIIEVREDSDYPIEKLKAIDEVCDQEPLLPDSIFELLLWASRYYQCSVGEIFKTALPSWLRKAKAVDIELLSTSTSTPLEKKPILNVDQQKAVNTLAKAFNSFQTFLLEGVTGSGKTEVYARLVEMMIAQSKQVLILVPEIGLTPQIIQRFAARFAVPIANLHSTLTEKQRYKAWCLAKRGLAPIVIGTRSAVFTPLKNPGLFIIDEEHDLSFKQQEGVRYSARDLLIMRGQKENCPVVLGTATPSLETLHNVHMGRYSALKLPLRAGIAKAPHLQILDIRHKKLEEGLSASLLKTMGEHLEQEGQVLLFLNRRGFAPIYMCFDCGWIQHCTHCDAKITFHKKLHKLICHHCFTHYVVPTQCPQCHTQNLHPLGMGTERLETVLQKHFPHYPIVRIDRDTMSKKDALKTTLHCIQEGNARILIGTQMLAKGHHFPNVTLVGILDIDGALFSIDFRSLERMGQLITQVAGRAGRAERLGTVLLQTCHPTHPLLTLLLEEGYPTFAAKLLEDRKKAQIPPFSHHVLIRADAKKNERALEFLNTLKREILKQNIPHLQVWGPTNAPMERRAGYHRTQLLLQSPSRSHLHNGLRTLLDVTDNKSVFLTKTVRWSIDVDPLDMY